MCIRDRDEVHKIQGQPPRHLIAIGVGFRKVVPGLQEQHGDCLLYTSDAADERSSVDLGGRRIIKKKTQLRICGSVSDNKKNTKGQRTRVKR